MTTIHTGVTRADTLEFHDGKYHGGPCWLGLGLGVCSAIVVGVALRLARERNYFINSLEDEHDRADEAHAAKTALFERNEVARSRIEAMSESLSSVFIQLDLIDALESESDGRAAEALRRAQLLTRTSIENARRALEALTLSQRPVADSIESLVQAQGASFELVGTLGELPVAVAQVLLRAVAEGLSDAHICAPQASIVVRLDLTDPSWADVRIVNGPFPGQRRAGGTAP